LAIGGWHGERVEEEREGSQRRAEEKKKEFNAEFAENAEKPEFAPVSCELVDWLPWSLGSVAGAPNGGAEEKAGRSGRDDSVGEVLWGFEEADEVGGGFGGFFDLGDAAGGVVGGVELIGEDVGVGVDDAKEIVDGVRDCINFGGRASVDGCPIE